jgi:transposase InsO family protein
VGDALATLYSRLGIGRLHAKPHDPQARGKMERFWRTLREQCLDHVGELVSLHDVQVRLLAWLDRLALLSILLVGLPEMHDRLQLRKNRSLWSRIHTRVHLGEATPADTAE